jgi:Domain of unknown function (DUF4157)
MKTTLHPRVPCPREQSIPAVSRGLLQRKCACGGRTGPTGECEACRKSRLQRRSANPVPSSIGDPPSSVSEVPPIVHEVVRAPGQPLDRHTRAFMEPRFGHDFSEVRIHTDAKAVESAQAVNAYAYTVGRDVVFGRGNYAPETNPGRKLLAHELAHVIQQRCGSRQPIVQRQEGSDGSDPDQELDRLITTLDQQIGTSGDESDQGNQSNEASGKPSLLMLQAARARLFDIKDTATAEEKMAIVSQIRGATSSEDSLQKKSLSVSPVHDPLEEEADAIATDVVSSSEVSQARKTLNAESSMIQRQSQADSATELSFWAAVLLILGLGYLVTRPTPRTAPPIPRPAPRPAPRLPDLSSAVRVLQQVTAATILAMASGVAGAVQQVTDALEEFVRSNPRMGMRCSEELIVFREASRRALEVLADPRQFGDIAVVRAVEAFKAAANALAACLGLDFRI